MGRHSDCQSLLLVRHGSHSARLSLLAKTVRALVKRTICIVMLLISPTPTFASCENLLIGKFALAGGECDSSLALAANKACFRGRPPILDFTTCASLLAPPSAGVCVSFCGRQLWDMETQESVELPELSFPYAHSASRPCQHAASTEADVSTQELRDHHVYASSTTLPQREVELAPVDGGFGAWSYVRPLIVHL